MKKIIAMAASLMLLAGSASAQGLGSLLGGSGNGSGLLNTLSSVIYSYTGNLTAVNLVGNWAYDGAAIALTGDGVVANIAGSAAATTMEAKADEYLAKIGITKGALGFTFNEDLTFTCTIKGIPLSGTWKTLNDGNTVQLQFGKVLKWLNLTGNLKKTPAGCDVLFESGRFFEFLKSALKYVAKQSGTSDTFTSMTDSVKDMKLGFKLAKI